MLPITPLPVAPAPSALVDVAPFGFPLPSDAGIYWEDPRKIHRVVIRFKSPPSSSPDRLRLEYWGSRWPEQRLPEDREPGGGDVGWWELGNWYNGDWRTADAEVTVDGATATIAFRPVNAREFPKLSGYPAAFRYTLKIRVVSDERLPDVESIQAFTDSTWERRAVRIAYKEPPDGPPALDTFNGAVEGVERISDGVYRAKLWAAASHDPNTFDKTLVTIRGKDGKSRTQAIRAKVTAGR